MPDYPTYTPPTESQAQSDPAYTAQVGALDQQAALNTTSYAQQRQDLINSFQSSLDSINLGLKGAGIQSRGQYAGRNLYNAEGDLSGIGQQVGAANVAPYLGQIKSLNENQSSNLAKVGTAEAQSNLNTQNAKYSALQGVLGNLRTAAEKQYSVGQDAYNAQQAALKTEATQELAKAKLPGGKIDVSKIRQGQQAKGRIYLGTTNDVSKYQKANGKDSIFKIGNDYFGLGAKEISSLRNSQLSQQTKVKNLNKKPGPGKPGSVSRSNVFDSTGKQIGFGLFNPKTGQTTYQNLSGNQTINLPPGATVGSAPHTSVDPSVRADLVSDIGAGHSLQELFNAYPEMSVSEITSIYNSL